MQIRRFKTEDLSQINDIVLAMNPKWFTDKALKNIPIDSQVNNCLVAEQDNQILGFITYCSQNGEALINWLAVDLNHHREGIGEALITSVINNVKKYNISVLTVETIVEQEPPDGSYDETIKFYYNQGFKLRKEYDPEESDGFVFSKGVLEKRLV
ncbi:GNAT family N-acetyltransferase [Candidatus Dojkabacteria bacterium]|nr:GNAT family N-acetyltransferase [Candidatus Dojkabacteria bacterium]